jgi:hypothetical protein
MGQMKANTDVKITTALDYASGTADRNGAALDMNGFRGVLMVVKLAAVAPGAVTSIKAQQDTASGMGTATDLLGTAQTVADDDDNQVFIIDLFEPTERYVRLVVDKDGANACAESAIYMQYGARMRPVVNTVTDAVTFERHMSPAEGTA